MRENGYATRLRVARALEGLRVAGPAFRLRERWLARGAPEISEVGEDGLPLPPARLQVLVAGAAGPNFAVSGAVAAETLRALFASAGRPLEERRALLDFGVGCGRIARHWQHLGGPDLHGCDYNRDLVDWCAANLPFMSFARNELEPPLPYGEGAFDAVYAYSVFTHLRNDLQFAWIAEMRRVLEAGGTLVFTVHGRNAAEVLEPAERERFEAGELVERFAANSGSNLCSVFHPESWVRGRLLDGFEVVAFHPGGEAPGMGSHDVYVARRGD